MRLTAPTTVIFLASVVLAVLALLSLLMPIPFIGAHRFLVMAGAWMVLMVGVLVKGV